MGNQKSEKKQGVDFLLVEDDQIDAMTVVRAFKEIKVDHTIKIVKDGEAAFEYLNENRINKPRIIFLDLNMPRMNGVEFLTMLRNDRDLKEITVIILTTSNEERDKLECFKLGIAGYIIKPVDYKEFLKVVDVINSYWTQSLLVY